MPPSEIAFHSPDMLSLKDQRLAALQTSAVWSGQQGNGVEPFQCELLQMLLTHQTTVFSASSQPYLLDRGGGGGWHTVEYFKDKVHVTVSLGGFLLSGY